ncbi:MAG TPA: glycosyltransferase, partial [Steroidobacteraceae bacterium]|nr:glycosyltransferase [Steroidobacteraceae bacterium]
MTVPPSVQAAQAATPANDGLPIIQMFWHGAALTRVERLAMASFAAHGHPVHLHAYQPLQRVPEGVRLVDASTILPEQDVFRHAKTGSLAMFADWFRYRVLLAKGGIWSDTDVVCLRPLVYGQTEIYAWEDEHKINNAILGLAAGHPLAAWM